VVRRVWPRSERPVPVTAPGGQPVGIEDQRALALQAQPSAAGEIGQRLVHRLPGGADELGDLFLGQVVVDPQPACLVAAEAVREQQQRFGHAAGHIGEDQVGERGVSSPHLPGQRAQQVLGDLGLAAHPAPQRGPIHADRAHLGHRGRSGRVRAGVEDRQLAEHLRWAQDPEQVLAAVGGRAPELHLARLDDVEPVTGLAFGENLVAAGELDGLAADDVGGGENLVGDGQAGGVGSGHRAAPGRSGSC
jgi:hypothetical protein